MSLVASACRVCPAFSLASTASTAFSEAWRVRSAWIAAITCSRALASGSACSGLCSVTRIITLWFGPSSIGSLTVPSWVRMSENAARSTAGLAAMPLAVAVACVNGPIVCTGRLMSLAGPSSEVGFL
ncbi:hypothetical protein D3C71_1439680 [compost metagenome]